MTAADILGGLLRMNLAAGVAILNVIVLRRMVRPRFGARLAALALEPHQLATTLVSAVLRRAPSPADDRPRTISAEVLTLSAASHSIK